MRLKKNHRRRNIILSVVLTIALGGFLVRSNIFTIKTVEAVLKDANCVSESQIKGEAGILGQNFFLVNKASVEEILKEKFICIKKVDLSKILPDKVKLDILGREAKASLIMLGVSDKPATLNLATPSAQVFSDVYLIDSEGVIFSKVSDHIVLPKIYFYAEDIHLGESFDNLEVIQILEGIKNFLNIETTFIYDRYFVIFPNIGPKIIFGLDSSIDMQIASLQLILNKAKIDSIEPEFIDLRFDKPIVRYAPKKN